MNYVLWLNFNFPLRGVAIEWVSGSWINARINARIKRRTASDPREWITIKGDVIDIISWYSGRGFVEINRRINWRINRRIIKPIIGQTPINIVDSFL